MDSSSFFDLLQHQIPVIRSRLQALQPEALARRSGFLERTPRKIPILRFLEGLLALAPETHLSLERIASVIGLAANTTYTKQALHERLDRRVESFLIQVIVGLFCPLRLSVETSQAFKPFARVLIQDSTVERLPNHLADIFPGSGNQHAQDYACLKIQWVCDLKHSAVLHTSLSGFTRNDQAAAPDILAVVRRDDLVIRDLGYLSSSVLAQLQDQGAFFLTRHRHGVNLYDPQSGQPLDLKAQLTTCGSLDRRLLLGPERVPLRFVALPVPEEVANRRRHKAKTEARRRHRSPPSRLSLFLMGWNLFLTNVPASVWSPKTLLAIYGLRWRVEIIFKSWKSHLGLRQLNCATPRFAPALAADQTVVLCNGLPAL